MTTHDAVTDSHEPSYYEIALTNRQVLVAFVLLLLCLLGAFFSGVWVGRGATTQPQPTTAASPPPAGAPLEEYKFFSDDSGKAAGAPPAATTSDRAPAPAAPPVPEPAPATPPSKPGSTLLSDLGGAPPAPQAGPEEMGQAGEPPVAEPAPAEPTPAPPVPAPAPPVAAAETPAAPALAANEVVVQVFSSSDLAQARSIVDKLKKAGYQAFLSPVQVGAQSMQRVRIGPFTDRSKAQTVADEVKKRFRLDTWITR